MRKRRKVIQVSAWDVAKCCVECKRRFSRNEKCCPHCGSMKKAETKSGRWVTYKTGFWPWDFECRWEFREDQDQ